MAIRYGFLKDVLAFTQLHEAKICIIKRIQALVFSTEIRNLKSKAGISDRNRLTLLNPFID